MNLVQQANVFRVCANKDELAKMIAETLTPQLPCIILVLK
jgi:hypothetical protein